MIMDPAYQAEAALYKGAIPANTTVSLSNFDDCAKKSSNDMQGASRANGLVPAMNQGIPEAMLGAVRDVVTRFLNSDQDSQSAVQALARAARNN